MRAAAYRQRVTLRRPGERSGHILGQARKASLPAEERARAIGDPVFLSRAAAARLGTLCPDCGRRPVEVATTGFCGVCSTKFLERLTHDRGHELKTARDILDTLCTIHGGALVKGQLTLALQCARQRRHRDRMKRQGYAGTT